MALAKVTSLTGLGSIDGIVWAFLLFVSFMLAKLASTQNTVPLINGKNFFDLGGFQVRKAFATELPELLRTGLRKADVFRLMTPGGMQFVLSPKFAHEIASNPGLGPGGFARANFNTHIPGFEVLIQLGKHKVVQESVRRKLTRNLPKLTKPLSTETAILLREQWTDDSNWHEVCPMSTSIYIISRLSSIVFVGDEIGRNQKWLDIVVNYSTEVLVATQQLNWWPSYLRPLVAQFSPSCRKLREYIQEAEDILLPAMQQRSANKASEMQRGFDDAIEWFEEVGKGKDFDPTLSQMLLAFGSIHTSSDLLNQVLLDLCGKNDLIQELRKEIISNMKGTEVHAIALDSLKLMDSVLKESQRLKPVSFVTLGRHASRTLQLSDGTKLPKGSLLFVANMKMRDPDIYPNPDVFDPYRFANLREAGDKSASLVSTSVEHMGFGLGPHACPGRFFVATEIKIILCHMLLKYDLRSVDGFQGSAQNSGITLNSDRGAKVAVRRRQEETAA